MNRYKRAWVRVPSFGKYSSYIQEMNLYKDEVGTILIAWEGGWQEVFSRPEYGCYEFR